MEEHVNLEATPQGVTSKPIKKRVVVQDDRDRDDYDAFDQRSYNRKSSSGQESSTSETKARRELLSYLTSKGVDISKEVQSYKVHVKLAKNERHNDSRRSSPTITYTSPNGDVYSSKVDVFEALRLSKIRSTAARAEIYNAATKKFNSFVRNNDLPIEVDGIKVIEFGDVNSDESRLHSAVDIYPIGYDAELNLHTGNRGRSSTSRVRCEIVMKNGPPEFRISVLNSGQSYSASSESAVWKKVLQNYCVHFFSFYFPSTLMITCTIHTVLKSIYCTVTIYFLYSCQIIDLFIVFVKYVFNL